MSGLPPSDRPVVELGDRAEWRAWLETNHATSGGIRLALGKKGNSVTSLTYEDAVLEAVAFGWIDSTVGRLDEDRYTASFGPRKRGSAWSRSNKERVERLTQGGLMTPAGLAAVASAQADGSWTTLDDVEDLVVPGDLAEALAVDTVAESGFAGLSEGHRKMALYWIAAAKRPETRAARIAATVEAAARGMAPR